MKWEKLTPTADQKVRFCESCRRNVHYCDTIEEAREHAWQDDCVAVSLALVRRPGDISRPLLAGMIRLEPAEVDRADPAGPPMTVRAGRVSPPSAPAVREPGPAAPPRDKSDRIRPPKERGARRQSRRQNRNLSADDQTDE